MKKKHILFRVYVIIYFIIFLEVGSAFFDETENIVEIFLLPLIIPWCLVHRDQISKWWKGETYQDVIGRILTLACIIAFLERPMETFIGNKMIVLLITFSAAIITYFITLKKDWDLINKKPYIKFFIIFIAEMLILVLSDIHINVTITPESWTNALKPIVLLEIFMVLAMLFPLLLFINGIRKDQDLEPLKRDICNLIFGLLVTFYVIVSFVVFFLIIALVCECIS